MTGTLRSKILTPDEQFTQVDDLKLRATLVTMADRYNQRVRDTIAATYNDPEIHSWYRMIRASSMYDKGGKSKVHRKIIEFPNTYVYEFVDTVMQELYGPQWLKNRRALSHELVRPWLVIEWSKL